MLVRWSRPHGDVVKPLGRSRSPSNLMSQGSHAKRVPRHTPPPRPPPLPRCRSYVNTTACHSRVSYIDGDAGILRYRGYPIEQLAERSNFLEVWGGGRWRRRAAAAVVHLVAVWCSALAPPISTASLAGPARRCPTWWCTAACPTPASCSAGRRR